MTANPCNKASTTTLLGSRKKHPHSTMQSSPGDPLLRRSGRDAHVPEDVSRP